MSDGIVGRMTKHGIGFEAVTVGALATITDGVPNFNKMDIVTGQTFIEDDKSRGATVDYAADEIDDTLEPGWAPESSAWHPWLGSFLFLNTMNASEAGAGPYTQTMEPDVSNGKKIDFGSTIATNNRTVSVKEVAGQTGSRNIHARGGICERVDITFGEKGRIKVTPAFKFMLFDDAGDATGTFTQPLASVEQMVRDWRYKLGDGTPAALYSKEITLSFIAEIDSNWYAGFNDRYPFRFVYKSWRLEGAFMKPLIAGTDTQAKTHWHEGGDSASDQLLYLYTDSLADYSSAMAADGDMRFTLNIRPTEIVKEKDGETIERVNFKGVNDGTNNIWKFEQTTTAAQAWAS